MAACEQVDSIEQHIVVYTYNNLQIWIFGAKDISIFYIDLDGSLLHKLFSLFFQLIWLLSYTHNFQWQGVLHKLHGGNCSLLFEAWKLLASLSVTHFFYWKRQWVLDPSIIPMPAIILWSFILSFSIPFFLRLESSQWTVGTLNLSSSRLLLPHSAVFWGEGILTLPSICMDKSGMRANWAFIGQH